MVSRAFPNWYQQTSFPGKRKFCLVEKTLNESDLFISRGPPARHTSTGKLSGPADVPSGSCMRTSNDSVTRRDVVRARSDLRIVCHTGRILGDWSFWKYLTPQRCKASCSSLAYEPSSSFTLTRHPLSRSRSVTSAHVQEHSDTRCNVNLGYNYRKWCSPQNERENHPPDPNRIQMMMKASNIFIASC